MDEQSDARALHCWKEVQDLTEMVYINGDMLLAIVWQSKKERHTRPNSHVQITNTGAWILRNLCYSMDQLKP